jgi:hypothetical protein
MSRTCGSFKLTDDHQKAGSVLPNVASCCIFHAGICIVYTLSLYVNTVTFVVVCTTVPIGRSSRSFKNVLAASVFCSCTALSKNHAGLKRLFINLAPSAICNSLNCSLVSSEQPENTHQNNGVVVFIVFANAS